MSSASAAKSAERIDGAIFTARLYRSVPGGAMTTAALAPEPHRGEPVGAVAVRTAPQHSVGVEREWKRQRRIAREVGAGVQERPYHGLVLLGLQGARGIHEAAAFLHHGSRGRRDLDLTPAADHDVRLESPPLHL